MTAVTAGWLALVLARSRVCFGRNLAARNDMRNATQRDWRETLGLLILGWPVLPLLALAFSGLSRAVRRHPSAELVSLRRFDRHAPDMGACKASVDQQRLL